MSKTVNLAIQILPMHMSKEQAYSAIDAAIAKIEASGLKYVVCPFETVIEGPYEEVMKLVDDMQDAAYEHGAENLIVNMKLHRSKIADLYIDDKIGKYR